MVVTFRQAQLDLVPLGGAVIDGAYRYSLHRELGGSRTLAVVGLNPSVADADDDDPTTRRLIGFARRWGMGRLRLVNVDAYIATDPNDLEKARADGIDVKGPENDAWILRAAMEAHESDGIILAAWGAGVGRAWQDHVLNLLGAYRLECLGRNANGTPKHPLYVAYEVERQVYTDPGMMPGLAR